MFEVIGSIREVKTIATGREIRELRRLKKAYGVGLWHKRKGIATRSPSTVLNCEHGVFTIALSGRVGMARRYRRGAVGDLVSNSLEFEGIEYGSEIFQHHLVRASENPAMVQADLVPVERVERAILVLRGHRVLLDADLAEMYGVETRVLVQAVKRNRNRFPDDFMFQLTLAEVQGSRSQSVILNAEAADIAGVVSGKNPVRGKNIKYLPFAFTEQGVAMLSTVLRSPRAVQVNIEIMRAFVRLRQMLQANAGLARKLAALETMYDGQFRVVFDAIREWRSKLVVAVPWRR